MKGLLCTRQELSHWLHLRATSVTTNAGILPQLSWLIYLVRVCICIWMKQSSCSYGEKGSNQKSKWSQAKIYFVNSGIYNIYQNFLDFWSSYFNKRQNKNPGKMKHGFYICVKLRQSWEGWFFSLFLKTYSSFLFALPFLVSCVCGSPFNYSASTVKIIHCFCKIYQIKQLVT